MQALQWTLTINLARRKDPGERNRGVEDQAHGRPSSRYAFHSCQSKGPSFASSARLRIRWSAARLCGINLCPCGGHRAGNLPAVPRNHDFLATFEEIDEGTELLLLLNANLLHDRLRSMRGNLGGVCRAAQPLRAYFLPRQGPAVA